MALGRRNLQPAPEPGENETPVEGALVPVPPPAGETPIITHSADPQPQTANSGVEISSEDTLPVEIDEADLEPFLFTKQRGVRAVFSKPRMEEAKDATPERKADWWFRPGKRTHAMLTDFVLRGDQPEHPELIDYKGMRISFCRFIAAPGQRGQQIYNEVCTAWGIDPRKPDLRAIEDVPCIISVSSSIGKDGKVYHNINKVTRDIDFEAAHGGSGA